MEHNEKWTLGRNLAKRDLRGREALDSGEFKIMKELDDRWDKACASSFIFDEASKAMVKERVIDKVQKIADGLGIKLFLCGRDYPIHATIHYGFLNEADISKRTAVYDKVYSDSALSNTFETALGQTIDFKYLRIHDGIITLDAIDLSEDLQKMRQEFTRAARENGVEPITRDNVLHISIAQLTDVPDETREEAFKNFKDALISLRHEISLSPQPLRMKIDRIFNGSDIMYQDPASY